MHFSVVVATLTLEEANFSQKRLVSLAFSETATMVEMWKTSFLLFYCFFVVFLNAVNVNVVLHLWTQPC